MEELPAQAVYVSLNHITHQMVRGLERIADQAEQSDFPPDTEALGTISIIATVAALEAFTNCYFRLIAEEKNDDRLRKVVSRRPPKDLGNLSLLRKLALCCEISFSQAPDQNSDVWKAFEDIVARRNNIVHFKSDFLSIDRSNAPELGNVKFQGASSADVLIGITRSTPRDLVRLLAHIVMLVADTRGLDSTARIAFVEHWLGVT